MKYCSECGAKVNFQKVHLDEIKRYVCEKCNKIHYKNPICVAGTLLLKKIKFYYVKELLNLDLENGLYQQALLKKMNPPALQQKRSKEEAGIIIEVNRLFALINVTHVSQVHCFYLGRILKKGLDFGHESTEIDFFKETDVPWDELSFPTVKEVMKHYYQNGEEAPVLEMELSTPQRW